MTLMSRAASAQVNAEQPVISLVGPPDTDAVEAPLSVPSELSVSAVPPPDTALLDDPAAPSVLLPIGSGRQPDLDHVRLVASTAIGW